MMPLTGTHDSPEEIESLMDRLIEENIEALSELAK